MDWTTGLDHHWTGLLDSEICACAIYAREGKTRATGSGLSSVLRPWSSSWKSNVKLVATLRSIHNTVCVAIVYCIPLSAIYNKWKNHFYEMKGDVGMSLHEKERNKKMPTPRHKITHNPIPTSLFCFNMLFVCLFVCSFVRYECIRQSKQQNILTSNCLRNMLCCGLGRHKDVGMGL